MTSFPIPSVVAIHFIQILFIKAIARGIGQIDQLILSEKSFRSSSFCRWSNSLYKLNRSLILLIYLKKQQLKGGIHLRVFYILFCFDIIFPVGYSSLNIFLLNSSIASFMIFLIEYKTYLSLWNWLFSSLINLLHESPSLSLCLLKPLP
jgi:hypothetical protein